MQFARVKPRASAEVAFTIDSRPARARVGDTLMTAMLLNAPALRRFEFGEGARAGFCLMGACQDCFVAFVDGSRVRACTTLVSEGMAVLTGASDG
ncbi:MAG: (2Fe-2S)-binding protein [Alphaproteobacteria bacterium]|nr:(2Fe-2S)-binding protein [Alphaproteobacteria bacterium]